jgi:hypothetical protein
MLLNQKIGVSFFRNNSHDLKVDVYWSNGSAFDLINWSARLIVGGETVKDSINPGQVEFIGSSVIFKLKPDDSTDWANRVRFEVEIYKTGEQYTVATGVINFLKVSTLEEKKIRIYRGNDLDVECWGNWEDGTAIDLIAWSIRFLVNGVVAKDSVNQGEITIDTQTNRCLVHLKEADSTNWASGADWQIQVYDGTDTYTFDSGRVIIE